MKNEDLLSCLEHLTMDFDGMDDEETGAHIFSISALRDLKQKGSVLMEHEKQVITEIRYSTK